jgi:hypothetical protein
MTCIHLQQLYDLCRQHNLKLGGSDLIRVVCHQCGQHEVCPSTLREHENDDSDQLVAAAPPADQQAAGRG